MKTYSSMDKANETLAETDSSFRFTQLNDYAWAHEYLSGFPNFHEANYDGDVVRGNFLLRNDPIIRIEWRDIRADVLRIYDGRIGFIFNARITDQQRARVLRRHSFARDRVRACGTLNNDQKNRLIAAYKKRIRHDILVNSANCGTAGQPPCAFAQAGVGGDWMNIDFNRLFPWGDNEIAQTLIHEMMHSAGYNHPERRTCSIPPAPPVPCDRPGDNGPYYGTPPLQAEICIAGVQSDTACNYEKDSNSFRNGLKKQNIE